MAMQSNLATRYLGLDLRNPVIVGSCRLTSSIDGVKKCAEAGAGAVVLKSLFEEQITAELQQVEAASQVADVYAHAAEYIRGYGAEQAVGEYLKLVEGAKKGGGHPGHRLDQLLQQRELASAGGSPAERRRRRARTERLRQPGAPGPERGRQRGRLPRRARRGEGRGADPGRAEGRFVLQQPVRVAHPAGHPRRRRAGAVQTISTSRTWTSRISRSSPVRP